MSIVIECSQRNLSLATPERSTSIVSISSYADIITRTLGKALTPAEPRALSEENLPGRSSFVRLFYPTYLCHILRVAGVPGKT
jgi:hypothetical protein